MSFMEPQGDKTTNSQLVISEAMASCSLDALMRSPIGLVHLSTDRLNRMFEVYPNLPPFVMDSTTVGYYMPLFIEKLGKGKPLHAWLNFKDIDVKFGQYDTDMIFSYTLCMRFREDTGETKETKAKGTVPDLKDLFYDELRIVTTGSVK